nr:interleukin-17 receptor B isoform X2 [Labrus bergylta]
MLGVKLIIFSLIVIKVTANEIKTECREFSGIPPSNLTSPSLLADLKVELVTWEGMYLLNISWAINIDASIEYLNATRILIESLAVPYHCEYNPPLATANITGSKQIWFHYLINTGSGSEFIQAANIPLAPKGICYKGVSIIVPTPKPYVKTRTTQVPPVYSTASGLGQEAVDLTSIVIATFGCLASLIVLSCFYIIYKRFGAKLAISSSFKGCHPSPMLPVPVLVVYPAENSAFQRAVVALAEFLQWQGGCRVAVDIWQQGKIAELGPMRWLTEQAKAANRVLIVSPQAELPISYPSHLPNDCFPTPSIPASAQDLYPLVLNMVVSHAKSSRDLAKFWVVQLGDQQQYKRCGNLVPELRACKTFCVMKDLNKLCMSLHEHAQENIRISTQILKPGIVYSEKSVETLREAVEMIK